MDSAEGRGPTPKSKRQNRAKQFDEQEHLAYKAISSRGGTYGAGLISADFKATPGASRGSANFFRNQRKNTSMSSKGAILAAVHNSGSSQAS